MASFAPSPADAADIGITGMAVMGSNLARNFARNGFQGRDPQPTDIGKTEAVIAEHGTDGEFYPSESMEASSPPCRSRASRCSWSTTASRPTP